MTTAGFNSIVSEAEYIGDNVYNFIPLYKEYEPMFEKNGVTVERKVIEDMLKPDLLKIYDDVMFYKQQKDISNIFATSQASYNFKRYDITGCTVIDDNVKIADRQNGEYYYIAIDQIMVVTRFPKELKLDKMNYKTGEIEETDINENQVRLEDFYTG